MQHPAQNAGVDQVLKCAQDNLAAFKTAVENEDVATLRSMLRAKNTHYDAACKRYGVPKAPKKAASTATQEVAAVKDQTSSGFLPSFLPGFLGSAVKTPSAKSRQQKAAAALEVKAREVAAGMDVRVDKNGQLVTTIKATKAVSDEEMQRLGLWLPPVGFNECNGDIFKVGKVGRAAKGFLPAADSAFKTYVKKQLGVQGAGTFSSHAYVDPFPEHDFIAGEGGMLGLMSEL